MGAGKSAVLAEASDILTSLRMWHAAIDLDALAMGYFPSATPNDDVMYRNLEAVCRNYGAHGVPRLLVARAIEDRSERERCCKAAGATSAVVCRLLASVRTMEQRVAERESGMLRQEFIARVAILNGILDRVQLEDFSVSSENRSVTNTAREMLVKAGWISE